MNLPELTAAHGLSRPADIRSGVDHVHISHWATLRVWLKIAAILTTAWIIVAAPVILAVVLW